MDYRELEKSELFKGLNNSDICRVCGCLGTCTKTYKKGAVITRKGEVSQQFGVVLSGVAHSVGLNAHGEPYTVRFYSEGEYINAASAISGRASAFTVKASGRLTVLHVPVKKIVRQCPKVCAAHAKVANNLMKCIAGDALFFQERADCLSKPTIRGKVTAFFDTSVISDYNNGLVKEKEFTIPFNREELAEYLGVERSALSRELSKMKKDGLIDFDRNVFKKFW